MRAGDLSRVRNFSAPVAGAREPVCVTRHIISVGSSHVKSAAGCQIQTGVGSRRGFELAAG